VRRDGARRPREYAPLAGGVRTQLTLNSYTDFENFYVFKPTGQHEETLNMVFDQVMSWGTALKPVHQ
jgi:hypothetical protein